MGSIKRKLCEETVCNFWVNHNDCSSTHLWFNITKDLWVSLDMNLWANLRDVIKEHLKEIL